MVEDALLYMIRAIAPTVYNKIISSISTKDMKSEELILLSLCVIAENNTQICRSIDKLVDVINALGDRLESVEKALVLTAERIDLMIRHRLE